MEEAVALRAIFGDSFTLVAGLPHGALDSDTPDPGELAAKGPVRGSRLECQLQVFVDVPAGYRLEVRSGGRDCVPAPCPTSWSLVTNACADTSDQTLEPKAWQSIMLVSSVQLSANAPLA